MTPLPIFYLQPYFSALGTALPKSLTEAFPSIAASMFVKPSEIYKSIIEIFCDEVFIVRNTVKTGQSLCSAVI